MTDQIATDVGSSTVVFDKEDLMTRVGGDLGFLEMILEVFCADYPTHLQSIDQAIQQKNPDNLRIAAHSLKGSASNLSGKLAAEHGLTLENLARESRFDECPAVARQLSAALQDLATALQAEVVNNKS